MCNKLTRCNTCIVDGSRRHSIQRVEQSKEGSVRITALLLLAATMTCGTLTGQTLSRSPLASPVYPLKASANGRYLTDSNSVPFLLMGDSPQSMIANLPPHQMSAYMANRRTLGFNSILVDALCTSYTFFFKQETAYDSTPPFTTGTDPSN